MLNRDRLKKVVAEAVAKYGKRGFVRRSGVSASTLDNIKDDAGNQDLATLEKIAAGAEIDFRYLFTQDDEPSSFLSPNEQTLVGLYRQIVALSSMRASNVLEAAELQLHKALEEQPKKKSSQGHG